MILEIFTGLRVAILVVVLVRWILRQEPAPIAGIYSQPGRFYHLKYALFYLIFSFRQVKLSGLNHATQRFSSLALPVAKQTIEGSWNTSRTSAERQQSIAFSGRLWQGVQVRHRVHGLHSDSI